jgi:hypothetical protein
MRQYSNATIRAGSVEMRSRHCSMQRSVRADGTDGDCAEAQPQVYLHRVPKSMDFPILVGFVPALVAGRELDSNAQ